MSAAGNAGAGEGLFPVLAAILDADRVLVDDTSGLDRIVGLDRDGIYVTIESGVTWQGLRDALKQTNPGTPCRGPVSGEQGRN